MYVNHQAGRRCYKYMGEQVFRDNLLPPNPRNDAAATLHAGAARNPAPPPQPHRPPEHRGLIGTIIAIASWPVILFGHDLIIVLAAMIGFIASFSALIAAVSSVRLSFVLQRACLPSGMRHRLKHFALAGGLSVLNSWACMETNSRWRDIDRSIVTQSLLRQIGQGVEDCRKANNISPTNLDQLVAADLYAERWLILPTDKEGWLNQFNGRPTNCSIAFMPEAAIATASPKSILAYERGPWSTVNLEFFPKRKHSVIFADGCVELLSPAELATALQINTVSTPRQ